MAYDFGNAVQIFKTAVTEQYWDVEGRTSRSDFWHYFSIAFAISIALNLLMRAMPALAIVSFVVSLGLLGPGIGMSVRRMHDLGKPWWMMLIPFYSLYLACLAGEKKSNQFGDDPLGSTEDVFS